MGQTVYKPNQYCPFVPNRLYFILPFFMAHEGRQISGEGGNPSSTIQKMTHLRNLSFAIVELLPSIKIRDFLMLQVWFLLTVATT